MPVLNMIRTKVCDDKHQSHVRHVVDADRIGQSMLCDNFFVTKYIIVKQFVDELSHQLNRVDKHHHEFAIGHRH